MIEAELNLHKLQKAIHEAGGVVNAVRSVVPGQVTASKFGKEAKMIGSMVTVEVFIPSSQPDIKLFNEEMLRIGVAEDAQALNEVQKMGSLMSKMEEEGKKVDSIISKAPVDIDAIDMNMLQKGIEKAMEQPSKPFSSIEAPEPSGDKKSQKKDATEW